MHGARHGPAGASSARTTCVAIRSCQNAPRFFRTLKEQLLWARHFQSNLELVRALEEFRALYNQHWLIERLGFEPPVQARQRLALQAAA